MLLGVFIGKSSRRHGGFNSSLINLNVIDGMGKRG
jgi:hypothetical protein